MIDTSVIATYDMGYVEAKYGRPRREYVHPENQRIYDQGYDDALFGQPHRSSYDGPKP